MYDSRVQMVSSVLIYGLLISIFELVKEEVLPGNMQLF